MPTRHWRRRAGRMACRPSRWPRIMGAPRLSTSCSRGASRSTFGKQPSWATTGACARCWRTTRRWLTASRRTVSHRSVSPRISGASRQRRRCSMPERTSTRRPPIRAACGLCTAPSPIRMRQWPLRWRNFCCGAEPTSMPRSKTAGRPCTRPQTTTTPIWCGCSCLTAPTPPLVQARGRPPSTWRRPKAPRRQRRSCGTGSRDISHDLWRIFMNTIETIVRSIQRELTPQFEQRLRAYLQEQDKAWLVEQVVRLTLDAHSLSEMDRRSVRARKERQREERIARVRELALDETKLRAFIARYRGCGRERLVREGFLEPHAPHKGTALLGTEHRTARGQRLLNRAKDTLFAILFGDEA